MSCTDDVIRLASLRHQLCVLDVCQRTVPPPPTPTPPSAETNWSRNCMPDLWRVPETPLCFMSKSKERLWHWNRLPHFHDIEAKKSPLLWPAAFGNLVGGGLLWGSGQDRVSEFALKVVSPHTPDGLLCRLNNIPVSDWYKNEMRKMKGERTEG